MGYWHRMEIEEWSVAGKSRRAKRAIGPPPASGGTILSRLPNSPMQVKQILQELALGNSVAEFDTALERYFVETATFRSLVSDEADIIAGDKGTGKTALFRILSRRYTTIPELSGIEIIAGFNPAGNPVFQRLAESDVMEEGQYVTVWKAYILSLVGNLVLQLYEGSFTGSMFELDRLLESVGIRTADDSPSTVFSQIVNLLRRLANPKSVEVAVTASPQGLPVLIPKATFSGESAAPAVASVEIVRHDDALGLLNRVLEEIDLQVWVVLDRLDEAFQGFPAAELPALRALLRTYLDLTAFPFVRLKLFVRKDLFRRIIGPGFVNLTHVNARKVEIVWDEDDLFELLVKRIRESPTFLSELEIDTSASSSHVFEAVFPPQVDVGLRKPVTWKWMMSRVRDGNDVRPPRNLIELVKKAQDAQMRREERSSTEYMPGTPVIGSDALKRGLAMISSERVGANSLSRGVTYNSGQGVSIQPGFRRR